MGAGGLRLVAMTGTMSVFLFVQDLLYTSLVLSIVFGHGCFPLCSPYCPPCQLLHAMSSIFSFKNWDQLLVNNPPSSLQPSAPTLPLPDSTTLHPGSSSRSLFRHPGSSLLSLSEFTLTTPSSFLVVSTKLLILLVC